MSLLGRLGEILLAGGPVMIPLALVSIWLWTLILLKTVWLISNRREVVDLAQARGCLEGREPAPPKASGPRGRLLAGFLRLRSQQAGQDQLLLEVALRREVPELDRHLSTMMVLATAAPLLGLLGTVSGMIDAFEVIQSFGTGNARALAAGISTALITTQTGLLVAIPGLLATLALRRQTRGLMQGLMGFYQALARGLNQREAPA